MFPIFALMTAALEQVGQNLMIQITHYDHENVLKRIFSFGGRRVSSPLYKGITASLTNFTS